jgi:S1-C subfamily serine protease
VLAVPLLALACQSTPEVHPKPVRQVADARLKDIGTLISSGSYLQALQEVSSLRGEAPADLSARDVDATESRALDALGEAFRKAIADKKFADAERLFQSATAYGKADAVAGWTLKTLDSNLASSLDSSGEKLLSLFARLRGLSLGEPTEAELTDALSYAVSIGNNSAVRLLAGRMKDRGMAVPAPAQAAAGATSDFARMIKGTVTMWVNKGIKIEKGVGYPDRVIGSGFFIDPRGYLLTNYHVIKSEVDPKYEGYSRLFVRLSDTANDRIPAKVVGYDTVFDIALVKVEITPEYVFSGLPTGEVAPGDRIFAIGSPAGLEKTVTSGIVSATERRFLQMGDTIQIDVPVNPGNSGGPLLDEKGDVIGVVFAGLEQFQGLNFAIPYYWIEKILPQLYAGGEVVHPWLGMALAETEKGLEVTYVVPEEPAWKAGIEAGDIIEGIDGKKYTTLRDIQEAVLANPPPSLVRVAYTRGAERREQVLCLTPRPQSPIEVALNRDSRDAVLYPLFGLKLQKVGSFLWKTDYVVQRVAKGSVADESGLSENDPLAIQDWQVDKDKGYAILQLYVKKKKSGFIESVVQIASYLETDNFI